MTAEASNKVIHGLWIGPRLSPLEQVSIRSFLHCGHEYHLYDYGPVQNVPEGSVLRDANEIIPSDKIFTYRDYPSYAGFSNFFRYKLLYMNGGWWADLDLVCLKPFNFEAPHVFSSEDLASPDGRNTRVNVGAIKAPAGSPLMGHLWDVCQSKDPTALAWGEVGPDLLAAGIHMFGMEEFVQEPAVFCPLPFSRWTEAIDPHVPCRFGEETYAVHLWNEMWRREGFDKDDEYDGECFYERMKSTYLNRATPVQPAGSGTTAHWASSPSVSALILSKNGSRRLGRCLESIQRTGFAN